MKVKILELDVPNKNGRIYPTDVIAKSLKSAESLMLGQMGYDEIINKVGARGVVDISSASHMIDNLKIEDGHLVGDVTILRTPKDIILEQIIDDTEFRPIGIGTSISQGDHDVITRYTLLSISAINREDAS